MVRDSWSGLVDSIEITRISREKKDEYLRKNVDCGKEQYYIDNGWEITNKLKTKVKMTKKKPSDVIFEDRVWYVLSKMNFSQMNSDRKFRIPISDIGNVNPAQVDVFAIDESVAIVVECKTSEKYVDRSIKNDIIRLVGLKEKIIKSVHHVFARDIKVGFVLATNNIGVNEQDLEFAKDNNIACLNENDFEYYDMLQSNIKQSSKYQFLSDIFENRDIEGLAIRVPAIKGNMGGDMFYSFVIEPSKLLPIAYVSHRSKNQKNDKTYQRIIKSNRLKEIRSYVEKENGLFPNSIIINIHSGKNKMVFEPVPKTEKDTNADLGLLSLPKRYKVAWVIDGQHRLYGFTDTKIGDKVTIPVIAFENLDGFKEARMFIDINSKQVRVARMHLENLTAELHWCSPFASQKLNALISKVTMELTNRKTSPLYNLVKLVDTDADKRITMPSLTSPLRKTNLFGKVTATGTLEAGVLYNNKSSDENVNMDKSLERGYDVLSGFFSLFAKTDNWKLSSKDGGYLSTGDAIQSEILLLSAIIKHIQKEADPRLMKAEDLLEEIASYTRYVVDFFKAASNDVILSYKTQRGAQGQSRCAYEMMEVINQNDEKFQPEGLEKHVKDKTAKWNEKTRDLIPKIQLMISGDIIKTLKDKYGDGDDGWWKQGVPQDTRINVASRRETESRAKNYEECFLLTDYEKIVKTNWSLFSGKYALVKGGKKDDQLKWFSTLIQLRNKISHPERGLATEDDYNFANKLSEDLSKKLGVAGEFII